MNAFIDGVRRTIRSGVLKGIIVSPLLLAFCLFTVPLAAQIKTTVSDNLVGPDGSPAAGTLTITAAGSFESADGYNVAKGWHVQAPVSNGSFSVVLIPNQGANPPGETDSYTVIYNLSSTWGTSYWSETWFVPSTGPVGLAAVRTLPNFPATFLSPQAANTILAGPPSGSSGGPASFRALVGADLPLPAANSLGGVQSITCANGQFINLISISGIPGCGTPGAGSVTSVGLSLPSLFTVIGSPVTGSGTLAATLASESASQFFAGPVGNAGVPAFRSIVPADVPTLNQNTTGNAATATAAQNPPTPCNANFAPAGITTNFNAAGCTQFVVPGVDVNISNQVVSTHLASALPATQGGLGTTATPTVAQLPIGFSGGGVYAPQTLSGDCTLTYTGAIICTRTNGASFAPSATTDTTNASNVSTGTLNVNRLPGSGATTINSITCTVGSSCTINFAAIPTQTSNAASVLYSGSYTSGATVTGSSGQTCAISSFNGGGTGATASIALTGTNAIVGGTGFTVTAMGSGYTSAPTSATLGNGTATCSGTIVVSTLLQASVTI